MFCYQCQETAKNKGCTVKGVCGKTAEVSDMQDLLIYVTKGLAQVNNRLEEKNEMIDAQIADNLFTTITNANFNVENLEEAVVRTLDLKKEAMEKISHKENLPKEALFDVREGLSEEAKKEYIGVLATEDEDIRSLRELITYGLKGMAAYTRHANVLGHEDQEVHDFISDTLEKITQDLDVDALVALTLKTGEFGVKAMALLDKANTSRFGNPEITEVNIGTRNNPGILISGHDLGDMEELLKQTEGTGVDVYTHSEMLPANYYPAFKKYDHFVGNYGGSWWHQKEEFASFNGPILMTTNCIVPPKDDSYLDRLYTTGVASYPGAKFIPGEIGADKDFSSLIEQAKNCQPPVQIEEGTIIGGFAHNQIFALADKVVDAIKSGAIRKFVVMGGCDGRQSDRNYYEEFAAALPEDTVILTAGCAKYRYNKLHLGDIGGIPRVLDAGQCNDSYSLAVTALKLKEIFGLEDINELPIAYNIAWYEQKAVIVFLALLSLGVKNIHLGPTLPAFLSENVVNVLVENFNVGKNSTVEEDIEKLIMA
ncbi:hydroxylamine reductase [Peptoniphilus sp. KCTC 25270]|uniref:hydroxylamine reductase n=1 Tax=Peptoniphilus sp. KCTC 25270 TaxID=2897414 RepID=UPI001E4B565E|nr:hydroxylamine reductase [Peptoniphilus sp. KCTC 25270]MCD1147404.1 hydroxylamine reductase [Peptoniphilus sp. KCTC 25270]